MAHYYTRYGEPQHNLGKNGGPTTLREARKFGLLPGVTTVLGVLPKKHLIKYRARELYYWSPLSQDNGWREPLEKSESESDDQYFERLWQASDVHAANARNRGKEIHREIETGQGIYGDVFKESLEQFGWEIIWQEKTLVGREYAGTADMLVRSRFGENILIDMKGREWNSDSPPAAYSDYIAQLGAYALICKEEINSAVTVMYHREIPGEWNFHLWPASKFEYGKKLFIVALAFWKSLNNYYP